ncbi:hypothetical protein E6R60_30375 [Streptomyces sp. A0642]|nr:hypothetical protein E6R60_30375 [Streptomyces sp. A0642]
MFLGPPRGSQPLRRLRSGVRGGAPVREGAGRGKARRRRTRARPPHPRTLPPRDPGLARPHPAHRAPNRTPQPHRTPGPAGPGRAPATPAVG